MEISSLNCIDKIIEQIGQLECFPRVLSRLALGEHYIIWNLLVRCILTFITTALAIKLRWYAEVFSKLKIHPINSDKSGNESQNTPYEKISNDVVLTWSQRKKYNERGYAETKLENKLRHVSIECVTVNDHDCFA